MKYAVHIYAVVMVKVADIEARSHKAAALAAERSVDLRKLFNSGVELELDGGGRLVCTEYADKIEDFMVDRVSANGDITSTKEYHYEGGSLKDGPHA